MKCSKTVKQAAKKSKKLRPYQKKNFDTLEKTACGYKKPWGEKKKKEHRISPYCLKNHKEKGMT